MKESMTSLIVAMDEKRGIGKGNDLLFRISEDFQRMKSLTRGHPIVMGSKTFESLGRILPGNRKHIVVTRNPEKVKNIDFYSPEVEVTPSLGEGIERAKNYPGSEEIFIFGGGQIFKEAMEKKLVQKLYLTVVEGDYGADTFFPDFSDFKKVILEQKGESEGYKYRFLELEK